MERDILCSSDSIRLSAAITAASEVLVAILRAVARIVWCNHAVPLALTELGVGGVFGPYEKCSTTAGITSTVIAGVASGCPVARIVW
ncbi:MAG: hypothetical protein KGL39_53345 [Patescibacteria group bacterium]|nr:hypothetical protein [Patescibacteria group bacterium]